MTRGDAAQRAATCSPWRSALSTGGSCQLFLPPEPHRPWFRAWFLQRCACAYADDSALAKASFREPLLTVLMLTQACPRPQEVPLDSIWEHSYPRALGMGRHPCPSLLENVDQGPCQVLRRRNWAWRSRSQMDEPQPNPQRSQMDRPQPNPLQGLSHSGSSFDNIEVVPAAIGLRATDQTWHYVQWLHLKLAGRRRRRDVSLADPKSRQKVVRYTKK